jgi:RNA polymerase sigma-70 factor (sigma-E family)
MDEVPSFEEFASSRARKLFQVAYLMCGDWHQAQDHVQTAFGKLYASWGRLQRVVPPSGLDAYARKVLLNSYLSHRRLRRSGELAVAELPETAESGDGATAELRLTLLQALRRLPPRNRAVVVLRYLEDHSIESVAEMLGTSPSAVKSLNTRSLARLRELLGEDRELLFRA